MASNRSSENCFYLRQKKADCLVTGDRGPSLTGMQRLGPVISHLDLMNLAGHPVFTCQSDCPGVQLLVCYTAVLSFFSLFHLIKSV